MSDIINGSASNLIKIAYTGSNALHDEQWKCDMILDWEIAYMVLATVVYVMRGLSIVYAI